ncbi:hypothetical protein GN956_G14176 [Arapaima gigas]
MLEDLSGKHQQKKVRKKCAKLVSISRHCTNSVNPRVPRFIIAAVFSTAQLAVMWTCALHTTHCGFTAVCSGGLRKPGVSAERDGRRRVRGEDRMKHAKFEFSRFA